jgi:drug/metabolite transporter (DMT)-like permease
MVSAFYRVFFGALILLLITLIKKEFKWRGSGPLLFSLLGGGLFALDLFFWHTSINYVGPGLATILGNFEVFLLSAFGLLFLGEKLRWSFILAIPLALLGLFLIVGIHWNRLDALYKTGVYYGLITACCYATYLLLIRKLQSKQNALPVYSILMWVSFASALFLGLVIFQTNGSFTIPDLQTGTALILLGLFSQTIGWILIANALPRLPASFSGLVLLLQPAFSFIWDVLFFTRATTLVNWLGVIIALAAIYMGMAGAKTKTDL